MKMGFDLDGVVIDSLPEMVKEGQRLGCIPQTADARIVSGRLEEEFCISVDDMKRILTPEVYMRSQPMAEIVETIQRWMEDGHQIHFVTARGDEWTPGVEKVTVDWLYRYGLYELCAGIHHVRSSKKWAFLKEAGIHVFVDDMPHVIRPMVGVIRHPFLLAVDQNRWAEGEGVRRWSWDEIRTEIDRLSDESTSRRSRGRIAG